MSISGSPPARGPDAGSGSHGQAAGGRVIVVGSINIDVVMRLPRLPAPGETVLGGVFAPHHGGKGANQAVAAARAGAPVHLVGAVGVADGADAVAALEAEGIDAARVIRCDGPTGHAVVLVDSGTGENQIAVAPGANALVSAGQVSESFAALAAGPEDVVVLSFELPAEPLREAARIAAQAGARIVVNPAPAQTGREDLLAGAIITPNGSELRALVAQAGLAPGLDPESAALTLARHTGGAVIVTLGADGALLADGARGEHFAAHRVRAADTTGAGDTLTGVLAASLAQGDGLRDSVRRAVAAATLAVTRPGARAGMPTAAEVDDALLGSA
jgi:ribokinase